MGIEPYEDAAAEAAKHSKPLFEAVARQINRTGGVVEDTLRWAGTRLGGIADTLGAFVMDPIRVRALANRVRCIEQVRDLGVDPEEVHPDWGLRVMEAAQSESSDELLMLWAQLIKNGSQDEDLRHPGFIQTLKCMSPRDAWVLREWPSEQFSEDGRTTRRYDAGRPSRDEIPVPPDDLEQLVQLGVFRWAIYSENEYDANTDFFGEQMGPPKITINHYGSLELTAFGRGFLAALGLPPEEPWDG